MTNICSRSDPNIGQVGIDPMTSMSWIWRWSEPSCVSSRHQHDEEWRNEVQDQDEPSRRDHMLEDCHTYDDHGYGKTCPNKRLSRRSMGEQFASLPLASAIKKGVPSWGDQDHHHHAQVEYAQDKGMILIGFDFYRSRGISCETGL